MFEVEAGADGGAAAALFDELDDVLDRIIQFDGTGLSTGETLGVTRRSEFARRRLEWVDHANIAELLDRNVAAEVGASGAPALLVGLLNVSPREARARVRAAEDLAPRTALTGEKLGPVFGEVAAAQAAGVLSAEHAFVITKAIKKLPAHVRAEHGAELEKTLVEAAESFHAGQVASLALRASAVLDPDGQEPDDREHERKRALTLTANRDGSGEIHGHLTPLAFAAAQQALGSLSKPQPSDEEGRDPRTHAQRLHDGFDHAMHRLLRDGGLPDTGGTPTTLVLTMTIGDLEARSGYATTEHGGHVSVNDALRMAADAEIIPVVFNDSGGILTYGTGRRLATPGQRRALAARDKGCSFPGCDRPPGWTQAHHVIPWEQGGPTDLTNLTLLCGHHHRNFERTGWTCHITNGVALWTPPAWIDHTQAPRRNNAHD